ncbi:MAG: spermidine synthase [Candidatus Eisenbacteria bacterium]|nr:spermidine synthase [Candidatus Eisenbacteria bacterium]
MTSRFEELDFQQTPLGELSLRRRQSPSIPDEPVYEVKIGNELLMSSTVNASERALARLALEGRPDQSCDVLVGGLGLGYTAATVLEYSSVRSLVVIELLTPVIDWHRRRLVPMAGQLMDDLRCSLVEGDFFKHVAPGSPGHRERLYDIILLDIDHSAESWLHARHREFYTDIGFRGLFDRLRPGGVFGFWSASEPADQLLDIVKGIFPTVQCHEISFTNPHLGVTDANWILIAKSAPALV